MGRRNARERERRAAESPEQREARLEKRRAWSMARIETEFDQERKSR